MITNVGLVFAIQPGETGFEAEAKDIEWDAHIPFFMGDVNSELIIRELSGVYDVPQVLAMHTRPVSFHPETRFISVTFACVPEDEPWPQYTETTEITAVIETGAPHVIPRAVVDHQDRAQGLKVNKRLLP